MILRILRWWGNRRPYWHIVRADGSLYMGRWWLFGGSFGQRDSDEGRPIAREWDKTRFDALIGSKVAARLHHIASEDRGRDLHTHPFSFVSIVVAGWYIERTPLSQAQDPSLDGIHYRDRLRKAGSIARRRATDRHTIIEVSPGGVWTVFIMGRKAGSWGFWTDTGFVPWRNYRGEV